MQIIVFNAGSSSLKFDLLEAAPDGTIVRLAAGAFVDAADGSGRFLMRTSGVAPPVSERAGTLAHAATLALEWLSNPSIHGRDLLQGTSAAVHRIVHGGAQFRATQGLDESDLAALAELSPLAPLHNPPALAVIASVRRRLGPGVRVVGVFDTAYYAQLPEAAYQYAIPPRWRVEFGIRRYGFHGIAHRYLCVAARRRLPATRPTERIVSLQLGRGCSVTATQGARAVATSMGFTPLEGLVMGTRSGDVDPGVLLYVMERGGFSPAEMRRELNEHSGLLGLSGQSADMRELLTLERSGNVAAALALEVFCRRARHFVAAYIAELGGVDVIAFGGGIGENCPDIRRRIVAQMEWAGVALDAGANADCVGAESSIAAALSRTAIEVIPVDEAAVIASEAVALLSGTG